MNAPTTQPPTHPSGAASRRGFTLAELLVAVAVVIALSVAVGGIFSQVGKLVSTGTAVGEVDQMARAIERQMRDDFAAISNMRPEDTFFLIRERTLGDINRNGRVDDAASPGVQGREKAVYLSQEDKDYDTINLIPPYGQRVGLKSRAVSPRLDEMVFIAQSSDKAPYTSYQQAGQESRQVNGEIAVISYGHGLLPAPALNPDGTQFDPSKPVTSTNRPVRQLYPDGIDRAGNPNVPNALEMWGDVYGQPFTRNEFAGQFPLLRQPMILYGGRGLGNKSNSVSGSSVSPIGERNIAPFIRDREGEIRFGDLNSVSGPYSPWKSPTGKARLRLNRWGRTDICAQNLEDVKRWLEGVAPHTATEAPVDGTAFSDGYYDIDPIDLSIPNYPDLAADNTAPDHGLYYRSTNGPIKPNGRTIQQQYAELLRGTQSALAGVFTRKLCEPGQTFNTRFTLPSGVDDPDSRDTIMDQHAIFAERCSNFEIAWSDGSTWPGTTPLKITFGSGAGARTTTYNRGDVIWFDREFTRRQYRLIVGTYESPLNGQPDPEVIAADQQLMPLPTSTTPGTPGTVYRDRYDTNRFNIDLTRNPILGPTFGGYDWAWTGGNDGEYLALWGFRPPGTGWDFKDTAWVKPKMVRVRMTLHDTQGRLKNGKDYEFVFRIDQAAE